MKKGLIICFNIFLITIVFFFTEYIAKISINFPFTTFISNYSLTLNESYDTQYERCKKLFRPNILNENKNGILVLGCSFAYGHYLQDEQTFSYKLAKLTNKPVYNRAFDFFWGVHNAYYQFNKQDFFKEVPKVKTIIYIYIDDHINRAKGVYLEDLASSDYELLRYILEKNKLKQYSFYSKIPVLNINIIKSLKKQFFITKQNKLNDVDFVKLYFDEIKKLAKKQYGEDINFIIFNYQNHKDDLMQRLSKDDYIVISLSDLTNENLLSKEYQISFNDHHPNEKAWDLITPLLIYKLKELNIKL